MLLLVARLDALLIRNDPDLKEVSRPIRLMIELGMHHASASAHALNIPRANDRTVAHAVPMGQGAVQHVADDLHVTVPVSSKARARGDTVFVDDPQGAKAHVPGVTIFSKGEAVP